MLFSKKLLTHSMKGIKLTGVIGISALLITQGVMSNQIYASTTSTAAYNISEASTALNRTIPEGYVKPNYKLVVPQNSETPTSHDISSDEAGEIIVQELYRYFKFDASNQTLTIAYSKPYKTFSSSWYCNIDKAPNYRMNISIDSVTGELLTIDQEILTPNDSTIDPIAEENAFDKDKCVSLSSATKAFKTNKEANIKKAQATIVSSKFIPEEIKSVEYISTGLSVPFYGEKGKEKALGSIVSHDFKVTTVSDKVYELTLSDNLTRIDSISTPTYVAQKEANRANMPKDLVNEP